MASAKAPSTAVALLARDLLDHAPNDPMAEELVGWLARSGRFRAFVEVHRDKIRKKLRGAKDADSRRDVRAELRVAHSLLEDRRFELAYEPYGSGKRGPDFSVTFRSGRSFNLEVTRLRGPLGTAAPIEPLMSKLRQLAPGLANALLVAVEGESAAALDVVAASRALRGHADRKDDEFFIRRGFVGTRGFYDQYLRLGGVLVFCEGAIGDRRAELWLNRSARIPLPERAVRAGLLCLRLDS
jgi:hypothetical protein